MRMIYYVVCTFAIDKNSNYSVHRTRENILVNSKYKYFSLKEYCAKSPNIIIMLSL